MTPEPAPDLSESRRLFARREHERKRRRLKALALVFIATAAGFVIGVGATLLYARDKMHRVPPQKDAIIESIIDKMDDTVSLTPAEKERIAARLDEQMEKIESIREESFRKMQKIFGEMDDGVKETLGPDRFQRWYDYKEHRKKEWQKGRERRRQGHHERKGRGRTH